MSFKSKKDLSFHLRRGATVLCVVLALCAAGAQADWMSEMGFTQLQAQLGANMVTGAGITVAQVEAETALNGPYMPDTTYTDFAGKTFTDMSLEGGGVSSHATSVGDCLYGNSNMSPGITTIDVYEAGDFINNWLNFSLGAPLRMSERVANFSWIGSYGSTPAGIADDTQALQRFDYMLTQSHLLAVIATNNGASSTIPTLLTSSYNGITVGLTNGNDATGYTTIDGAGRIEPDIVSSGPLSGETSFVTPMVGSAAALLYQAANLDPTLTAARYQPEVIKAILMAGATKSQFPTWTRTPVHPLDMTYGAGELNVYNSYNLLKAGQHTASSTSTVGNTGWDYASATQGSNRYYYFDVTGNITDQLSVMLTWDEVITNARSNVWNPTVTLPNLDLKLYGASGFTLGSMIDSSVSAVDNLQCIYQTALLPGRYALEVSSLYSGNANYALAWQSIITTYLPGDTNHDGVVNSLDIDAIYQHLTVAPSTYLGTWPRPLLTWSPALTQYDPAGLGSVSQADVTYELNNYFHTNYGDANLDGATDFADFQALLNHWQQSGAGWAGADFNGDGVTDFMDFQILLNYWNPAGWNFAPSASQTPEPATLAIVLAGGLFVLLRRQRRSA